MREYGRRCVVRSPRRPCAAEDYNSRRAVRRSAGRLSGLKAQGQLGCVVRLCPVRLGWRQGEVYGFDAGLRKEVCEETRRPVSLSAELLAGSEVEGSVAT